MRIRSIAALSLLLLPAFAQSDAPGFGKQSPIPADCPVTLPIEPRYTPPPPHKAAEPDAAIFLHGSDALFTQLNSDGRWRGIRSDSGTRNKSFWYRVNPEWREEFPYQFRVTAQRLDVARPMLTFPRVNNAIMGEEVAMLLMLELPHGCWEVTGSYKSDALSFVVWVD